MDSFCVFFVIYVIICLIFIKRKKEVLKVPSKQ